MASIIRSSGWRLLAAPAMLLVVLALWNVGCSSTASTEGDDTASADSDQADTGQEQNGKDEKDKGDSSGDEGDKGEKDEKKETAVPVEVVAVARGDIQSVLRSSTNLEAENQVKVFSQAARLVRELYVEEGDRVRKDQLLVRLQDEEQTSALEKVESQYRKAAREYEQQKKLYEKELISEEVYNNATYEVEQLKISVEDARRELSYTEVRAPIAGTITNRLVQVGDQVTAGQHLFDLVDFDSIVARIYVPEKELPRLRVGQKARITPQGTTEALYGGEVLRISPVVDPQTGTVKVTVAMDDREGIRPGMYVDVQLVTDIHRDTLLVPKRALVYDQDQVFVFRLAEERRVEKLFLDPVLEDKEYVEPSEGFEPGDEIVVAGQTGLKDNSLVRLPGDPDPEKETGEDEDGEQENQVAEGAR